MKRANVRPLTLACTLLVFVASNVATAGAAPVDNRAVANRLVAQFVEAENTMNVDLFDGVFTTNYIQHSADIPSGLAGVKKVFATEFKEIKAAHIVMHSRVEEVLVDGDHVVLRQVMTIDKGSKHYEARSIDEWRIVNGRFGEHWDSDSAPRRVAKSPTAPK